MHTLTRTGRRTLKNFELVPIRRLLEDRQDTVGQNIRSVMRGARRGDSHAVAAISASPSRTYRVAPTLR